jgi:hypothetical protein
MEYGILTPSAQADSHRCHLLPVTPRRSVTARTHGAARLWSRPTRGRPRTRSNVPMTARFSIPSVWRVLGPPGSRFARPEHVNGVSMCHLSADRSGTSRAIWGRRRLDRLSSFVATIPLAVSIPHPFRVTSLRDCHSIPWKSNRARRGSQNYESQHGSSHHLNDRRSCSEFSEWALSAHHPGRHQRRERTALLLRSVLLDK